MSGLELALAIVGSIVGVATAIFVVIQLGTAGRGSFLKERNEELANALEQQDAQRIREQAQWATEKQELRDMIKVLEGQVNAYSNQYAQVIAVKVVEALEEAGWKKPA